MTTSKKLRELTDRLRGMCSELADATALCASTNPYAAREKAVDQTFAAARALAKAAERVDDLRAEIESDEDHEHRQEMARRDDDRMAAIRGRS